MIPIDIIILFIILNIYIYKYKSNIYIKILYIIICYLLLISLTIIFIDTRSLNSIYRPKLIELFNNNNFNNKVIYIDNINKDISNAILKSGASIGTHHSYSYNNTNNTVFNPIINFIYKIPIFHNIFNAISKNQTLTLKQQIIDCNVTYLDIRVSKINNIFYIDHGIILGNLNDFINDLNNINPPNKIFIKYKPSRHSNSTTYDEILEQLKKLNIIYEPIKVKTDYIQTDSIYILNNFILNSNNIYIDAILTYNISTIVIYFIIVLIITFILCYILFYMRYNNNLKTIK